MVSFMVVPSSKDNSQYTIKMYTWITKKGNKNVNLVDKSIKKKDEDGFGPKMGYKLRIKVIAPPSRSVEMVNL